MRYILKEKIFSIRESYYIQDEDGHNVYEITGHLISLRDKLTLRDQQGETLATITQKLLALRPVYTISRPGQPDVAVKKDFINILREGFTIDMPGDLPDLRIQGDILEHNYTISRHGEKVAEASKKWISLRDSYTVDVAPEEDTVLMLACALVVDRITHEEEEKEDKAN